MLKLMKNVPTALVLVLIINTVSFAQQTTPATQTKPEGDLVPQKVLKSRIFTINHRDEDNLVSVLRPLLSGVAGATISANEEFKTITVRDFPENIATIEEAIKRLDTPAAPRPNIELHMHMLVASNIGTTTEQFPAELRDVLTQLRRTLSYQKYEVAASFVQRLTETSSGLSGRGSAEISNAPSTPPTKTVAYEYSIDSVSLVQKPAGATTIQIDKFTFETRSPHLLEQAKVETALNLRDGEKVVVGTATIKDRALIIVLTAKLLN
ncbi:MAG TPA: secretin N-terminal domain-containing protein [Pyrinomonadaceae bacterium]